MHPSPSPHGAARSLPLAAGQTATSVPVTSLPPHVRWLTRLLQGLVVLYMLAILYFVWLTRELSFATFVRDPVFAGYSLAVVTYVLARFVLALGYRPHPDVGLEPTVSVIVPAFNEEDGIRGTIESILASDYPADKVEVIAVNDGSSDDTWARMQETAADRERLTIVDLGRNYGKRAAMAEGFRRSSGDIIVFVDSDSYLAADAIRQMVQPFADPAVGTVAGHADVANAGESWMTRMQQVRYFSAFRIMKGTESLLGGTVTCASGCSSAYRRAAIEPLVPDWEFQQFLGLPATFGDDRALTNRVLKDWKVVYQSTARAATRVPETLPRFLKQQLRWKKSWLRESLYLATYFWRKNKIAVVFTYASLVFPFLAPFVVLNAALGAIGGGSGGLWFYLVGTYAMAMVYSLYYALARRSGMWHHGLSFVAVYMGFLVFQTYWGIVRMRDNGWGTRDAQVTVTEVDPDKVRVLPARVRVGAGDDATTAPTAAEVA